MNWAITDEYFKKVYPKQMNDLFPDASPDWAKERETVIAVFSDMLRVPTGDGSSKRQAGTKPAWWKDPSHEGAMFSHLAKWKKGEHRDPDSGTSPLVHLAWRALALAYQEMNGQRPPL